jgi:hypothetical protein
MAKTPRSRKGGSRKGRASSDTPTRTSGKAPAKARAKRAVRSAGGARPSAEIAVPIPQRQFVFRGTVAQQASATFAEVPISDQTVVVRIDEVLDAPEALRDFAGQPVTVRLESGQTVEDGKDYVFHTDSWLYGAGLAVIATSVEPIGAESVSRLRAAASSRPVEKVRARADRADLVVTGQVKEVRQVEPSPGKISEHDPDWQEAVIRVDQVVGGKASRTAAAGQDVVVRFAASRDVKWARAPKFPVGQEGVWMLGEKTQEHAAMRAAAAVPSDHYLVLDPEDFHPKERALQVLSQIGTEGEQP